MDEGSDGWQKRLEYLENTGEYFVGRLTTILSPLVPIEALNSAVKTAHEIVGACRDFISFSPRISPEEPEELFQLFATGQRLIGPRLKRNNPKNFNRGLRRRNDSSGRLSSSHRDGDVHGIRTVPTDHRAIYNHDARTILGRVRPVWLR